MSNNNLGIVSSNLVNLADVKKGTTNWANAQERSLMDWLLDNNPNLKIDDLFAGFIHSVAKKAGQMIGTGGSDHMTGSDGKDTLNGGGGKDVLDGGKGDDTLNGGDGDDYIRDMFGNNVLDGGKGSDTLSYSTHGFSGEGLPFNGVTMKFNGDGTTGTATIPGATKSVFKNFEKFIGTTGQDVLDFCEIKGTVNISLEDGLVEIRTKDGKTLRLNFSQFEHFVGSAGNDQMIGDDHNNVFTGGKGNDRLFGKGGDDTLNGGDGDDYIVDYEGHNIVDGGTGYDTLSYKDLPLDDLSGISVVFSGDGSHGLAGASYRGYNEFKNIEAFIGSDGDQDKLHFSGLNGGRVRVSLVDGFADIIGSDGKVVRVKIQGFEEVYGGAGDDYIVGDDKDNFLYGGDSGKDVLYGGGGNDNIAAGTGATTAHGDAGDDVIGGGNSSDKLYGDAGDDVISGNGGNDLLEGGAGNDTLWSGEGDDVLRGGTGNDELVSTGGQDILDGGDGFDVADLSHYQTLRDGLIVTAVAGGGFMAKAGNSSADIKNVETLVADRNQNATFDAHNASHADIDLGKGTYDLKYGGANNDDHGAPDPESGANPSGETTYSGGIKNFQNAVGTSGSDTLKGNDRENILDGHGGGDRFEGRGGQDIILLDSTEGTRDVVVYSDVSDGKNSKGIEVGDILEGFNTKDDALDFDALFDKMDAKSGHISSIEERAKAVLIDDDGKVYVNMNGEIHLLAQLRGLTHEALQALRDDAMHHTQQHIVVSHG